MLIKNCLTEQDVNHFFLTQLQTWESARTRVEALAQVRTKAWETERGSIGAQFNPARIVSTAAKVDASSLEKRKCFLCAENQPTEQQRKTVLGKYNLCVNPFPILQRHFTLPYTKHTRQEIAPHIEDMAYMAWQWPSYVLFYNGAKCGASAPDHMHFQMGGKGQIPLQRDFGKWKETLQPLGEYQLAQGGGLLYASSKWLVPYWTIVAEDIPMGAWLFRKVIEALPVFSDEWEPRVNVLTWSEDARLVICIIPRTKHRPACYFEEGENHYCISPGSVDMGGLLICPFEKDFNRLTGDFARNILQEVAYTPEQFLIISQQLVQTIS